MMSLTGEVIYERPTWGNHLEFIIACLGHVVGLGNIWRFPHLCFKNGGGAFLIPYFLSLALMGIPLFFLEIAFGQFAGLGSISCWEISPPFKGFGVTMTLIVGTISIYYSVIIAICFYYLFSTFQNTLPWATCGNEWNTCYCREPKMDVNLNPLYMHGTFGLNCSGINITLAMIKSPAAEFYHNKVLALTKSIDDHGQIKWDLTMCNFFSWCLIFSSLIGGVKTLGKVAYISGLLPYFLMTGLLLEGLTLPGSWSGIKYYMGFDLNKILYVGVWGDAASQILFSLSCCMGTLIAMSSYNKFHDNCIRDSILLSLANCSTSLFIGFPVFSVVGFLAATAGKDIKDTITSGHGLVFVAYPTALSHMPLPQLWSVFFFVMMVLLGIGTQLVVVETVITAFQDEIRYFRVHSIPFRIGVCFTGFLLGLPQTTTGGFYVLSLLDHFINIPLLMVGFLESMIMVWVYTPKRFAEDMMMMLGYSKINRLIFKSYFLPSLMFATPCFLAAILISNVISYERFDGPDWAEMLGWVIVGFIMMWSPLWFIAVSYFLPVGPNIREGYSFSAGNQLFIRADNYKASTAVADFDQGTLQDYTTTGSDCIRSSMPKWKEDTVVKWEGYKYSDTDSFELCARDSVGATAL